MTKKIRILAIVSLVCVYLVILAGSVVRMTGSGMGCPDWPKCFGYLIPPTERSQIEWKAFHSYEKGQIIILDESLRVADEDFTSGEVYNEQNWSAYTKHDYAQFNASHTWTEYINRLVGVISGIPVLLLFVLSMFYVRKDWKPFALSTAVLFMLGFEAWLGKLVVDGNLIPGSITIHMMGALVIVALLCLLLGMSSTRGTTLIPSLRFRKFLVLALLLTLIQIVLGTQVREQVDILNKEGIARVNWIAGLNWEFYVHRSFSILILVLNVWLWQKNRKWKSSIKELDYVLVLIGLEILLGVILNYGGMPDFAQPLHLLFGTFLFGFQFYAVVKAYKSSPVNMAFEAHSS